MKGLNKILIITFLMSIKIISQSVGTKVQITNSSYQKAECSIAIDPTNPNNLIGCTITLTGDNLTKVGTLYSTNGGTTWGANEVLQNQNDVDPSVDYDANGNAYLCYIYNRDSGTDEIHIRKSTNKGQLWASSININALSQPDKPFITIDKGNSSSYKNNIYIVWTRSLNSIVFSKSTNGGATFSSEIVLASNSNGLLGAITAIGPNGELYIVYSIGHPNCTGIGFVKSTDGGNSFTSPVQIASVSQIGSLNDGRYKLKNNSIRVNSHPSIAVDPITGNLYVVFDSKSNNGDADVVFVKSSNYGSNWTSPNKVTNENTNTDQWFPWISTSPIGEISVVYYDSRVDPTNNLLSEVYISRSIDGGNTFSNYNVGNAPFTPSALPGSPSGNFMGDYIGIVSSSQKTFPIWADNSTGTFQIFASVVNFNQTLSLDQKRENGSSLSGSSIGKWSGTNYTNYAVPFNLSLSLGEKVRLKATQDIIQSPDEKFHNWSYNNNILNHYEFSIEPGLTQIISQLKTVQPSISIKNQLEAININSGVIGFADPWLIDYNESPYGLRNQGTNAPYKQRNSPFAVDYTTSYGGDIYKGVFLNQNPDQGNPNVPYYSVRAQATQTINGYTAYFQNWSATNASTQYTTALETPVVFTNANAVVSANYKGHLISSSSTGFTTNSQRKVVRTTDNQLHLVYESMGKVWYTRSTDNGVSWTQEVPINYLGNDSKNCSISYYGTSVYITYQSNESGSPCIRLEKYIGGVQNWGYVVSAISSYSYDTKPVVASYESIICVVYKPTVSSTLYAVKFQADGTKGSNYQISNTDANSQNPSIVTTNQHFAIAYQNSTTEIRYEELAVDLNTTLVYEYQNISSGSPYTNNIEPSISAFGSGPIVSWSGYNTGIPSAVTKRRVSGTWSGFNSFGSGTVRNTNNNSISDGTESSIIAWCDIYNAHKFVKLASGSFSSILTLPESSGNGQIQISNGYDFSYLKSIVYKSPTTSIYPVKFVSYNFQTLQKTSGEENMNYGRTAIIQKDKNNYVYYLGGITVDKKKVKFRDYIDTLEIHNEKEMVDRMTTETFHLTKESSIEFNNLAYAFDTETLRQVKSNNVSFSIDLVKQTNNEKKNELVVSHFDVGEITDDELGYRISLSGVEAGDYYLVVKSKANGEAKFYLNNVVYEDHTEVKKEANQEVVIELNGSLENILDECYPNPFNPSTQISFTLKEKGNISLKVYDVLGKEVANLVDGLLEAGKHTATFDGGNLASGIYFYRLATPTTTITKKMMLVK